MRRFVLPLVVAALSLAVVLPATAQETKMVKGTVAAMAADSLTIKAGTAEMKFTVDDKTTVEAVGAGTRSRAAAAAGKSGPKLSEVLKVGQNVEVSYHDMGGTLHAAKVRGIASLGGGAPTSASGTVSAISGASMTINGTSGGGTFTQTYVIDAKTRVVGKGAGTIAKKGGGRASVTDLIAMGDKVSVSFRDEGGTLKASTVTVTAKASK